MPKVALVALCVTLTEANEMKGLRRTKGLNAATSTGTDRKEVTGNATGPTDADGRSALGFVARSLIRVATDLISLLPPEALQREREDCPRSMGKGEAAGAKKSLVQNKSVKETNDFQHGISAGLGNQDASYHVITWSANVSVYPSVSSRGP